jgi:hypothetical protein
VGWISYYLAERSPEPSHLAVVNKVL